MSQSPFDTIVIGAGPAGLSAGLFAGLYRLKTITIGEVVGGELKLAPMIFDYPGIKAIKGTDWLNVMLEQVKEVGVEVIEKKVVKISNPQPPFTVQTEASEFETQSLIFATGNQKRRPNYTGSELARELGIDLTPDGFIAVNETLATNLPGVFAAGNCLEHPIGLEQLVDAAAQGTQAAAQAYEYLKGQKAPILWGKAKIPNL